MSEQINYGNERPLLTLSSFSVLFSFLFCILSSGMLLEMPVIGGAMYLLGRIAMVYGSRVHPYLKKGNLKKASRITLLLLGVSFILTLFMFMTFRVSIDNNTLWLMITLVFLILLRPTITGAFLTKGLFKNKKPSRLLMGMILLQIILTVLVVPLLFLSLSSDNAFSLLAGFIISDVLECVSLWRMRYRYMPPIEPGDDSEKLNEINAYKTFRNILVTTSCALQLTLIMTYTFIGCAAGALVLGMTVSFIFTVFFYILTGAILRNMLKRDADPTNILLVGLVLWLAGLLLFSFNITSPSYLRAYLSLALCGAGIGTAIWILTRLEKRLRTAVSFALNAPPSPAYERSIRFTIEIASLTGQFLALIGLLLISIFNRPPFPESLQSLGQLLRPMLVVPALLLTFAALVSALLFPMDKDDMEKLDKLIHKEQMGEENTVLREQLEGVVIRRTIKHYGIKIIMALMRPFYYHKILGRENVPQDDIPNVFVCNHGEVYGPIVTNLYVPYSFRPWVINEVMDKEIIIPNMVQGALTRFKLIPAKMREPIACFFAPFIAWIMRSVDAIPVYYSEPKKLMKTFRESINAMLAGDNILLFPENSDDTPDHRYRLSGVSHFFTGFTMLGQLYYNKTGQCVHFVPIYADKQKRTLTFGKPTFYDPDNAPNDEKERLCTYLRGEMLRIAGIKDDED